MKWIIILFPMSVHNSVTAILRKLDIMPVLSFKNRSVYLLILFVVFLLNGCKKQGIENVSVNTLQAYFETNILNQDFVVDLATDSSINKTTDYLDYKFKLIKTTSYLDGPMTGTKAGTTYNGTWSSNEDYSKLTINLNSPSIPASFIFLNRAWRFTKKELPVMQLAPWGTTDPKVLYMRRL